MLLTFNNHDNAVSSRGAASESAVVVWVEEEEDQKEEALNKPSIVFKWKQITRKNVKYMKSRLLSSEALSPETYERQVC